MDNKEKETKETPEMEPQAADALDKVLNTLSLNSDEELYALYLSMDKDLNRIAQAVEVPLEHLEQCMAGVAALLGPDKIKKMEDDMEALKKKPMPFGLLEPEKDEQEA